MKVYICPICGRTRPALQYQVENSVANKYGYVYCGFCGNKIIPLATPQETETKWNKE
uniref:Uncharacterized protein n=1 Tax=viral metagenome TaxID=1070528 RepID=A0A6M3JL40_9ZZZZ